MPSARPPACLVTGATQRSNALPGDISAPQLLGIAPGDPRLEPYWQLAEEFDVPVGIHLGPGPPGAAYDSSPAPFTFPAFGMALGDPLLLNRCCSGTSGSGSS